MTEKDYLEYWNSIYKKQNYFGSGATKLAIFAESIIKTKNVKKILDVGCGQGRDAIHFAQSGYDVTAIDISTNAIEFVNRISQELGLKNIATHVRDIQEEFAFDQNFDFVYSNLALQFFDLQQLEKILKNISNVMEENSMFVLSTKKEGDKYHKFGNKVNEFAYEHKGITRYFYPKEMLNNLLEKRFGKILHFESEEHTNLDSTVSVWWKIVVKK